MAGKGCVLFFTCFLLFKLKFCNGESLPVRISASEYVNIVSDRFLSFSVDPKHLFHKDKIGKDCLCMASSLSPAMLRIAGPSTENMDFHNSVIAFNASSENDGKVSVNLEDWKRFASWAQENNIQLMFALNNNVRTSGGLWDPNASLDILTAAHQAGVKNMVWQLGYECKNRSAEEYLIDLETLRVMVDTFPTQGWRVVPGDVTGCLAADSKTHFKDYLSTCSNRMDALFFDGNSTSSELDKLSPTDRKQVLEVVSNSSAPLWITEHQDELPELERAAEWMISLGYSARNGFDVNFRELREDELFEPTLSFYMSLLFKSLVGRRVLDVNIPDSPETSLFAHCTSLKKQSVPGAITLYGVNMDNQIVRFAVKFSKREEGGDIMQFILTQDRTGNTIINGYPMFHEGDIKPIVKRVRPYKTLLLTLPPRSFGFWVLANTNIEACTDSNEINPTKYVPATPVEEIKDKMTIQKAEVQREKRSIKTEMDIHRANNDIEYADKMSKSEELLARATYDEIENVEKSIRIMQKVLKEIENKISPSKVLQDFLEKRNPNNEVKKENHRAKRQVLGQKLKTPVTKSKNQTNIEKSVENIQIPRLQARFSKSKETSSRGVNTEKEIIESKPKKVLRDAKIRLEELRSLFKSKQHTLSEKLKNRLNHKRHTIQNTEESVTKRGRERYHKKRSFQVVNTDKPNETKEEDPNCIGFVRTKRNAEVEKQSKIAPFINKLEQLVLSEKDVDTGKHVMNMLQKIKESVKLAPKIEISEGDDDEITKRKLKNEIVKGETDAYNDYETSDEKTIEDQLIVKTKISDDDASISVNEKSNTQSFLKKAFSSVSDMFNDLNDKFSHLFTVINALD